MPYANILQRRSNGRKRQLRYYAKHRAKILQHHREHREWDHQNYLNRAEEKKKYAAKWRKNNPDRRRLYNQIYRSRKAGAGGSYAKADIERLFVQQKGRCVLCGERLKRFHIDHVMPLSRGGTNGPENIELLCHSCNETKKARHPDEVAKKLGRLFI